MDESIYRNGGNANKMYKMIRWHLYSDPFTEYIISINIKSLDTTVIAKDIEIQANINEMISEVDRYFKERHPDGKLVNFLNRIRILAEYEYMITNWKNFNIP